MVPGGGELARQLPGLRGLRLTVNEVRAKFKYDDKKPAEAQFGIAARLAERADGRGRGRGRDQYAAARTQLLRRHQRRTDAPHTTAPRGTAPRTTAPRTTAPPAAG